MTRTWDCRQTSVTPSASVEHMITQIPLWKLDYFSTQINQSINLPGFLCRRNYC